MTQLSSLLIPLLLNTTHAFADEAGNYVFPTYFGAGTQSFLTTNPVNKNEAYNYIFRFSFEWDSRKKDDTEHTSPLPRSQIVIAQLPIQLSLKTFTEAGDSAWDKIPTLTMDFKAFQFTEEIPQKDEDQLQTLSVEAGRIFVDRNLALDRALQVRVDVVGAYLGHAWNINPRFSTFLQTGGAIELWKFEQRDTNRPFYNGFVGLTAQIEAGLHFPFSQKAQLTLKTGVKANLDLTGIEQQEIGGSAEFASQSDIEAYGEIKFLFAEMVNIFAKAGYQETCVLNDQCIGTPLFLMGAEMGFPFKKQ